MILTFIFALMTAAALLAVLWPLRKRSKAGRRAGSDVEVYRDQLDEIERDHAAGRIGKPEADAARVEVSRRLIAAGDSNQDGEILADGEPAIHRRRMVAAVALLLLPVCAGSVYYILGSPGIPTLPLAGRLDDSSEQRPIEGMVAQVEAYLERNPQDGRGWEVVAPVYMQLGRYDDAVKARRHALEILGPDAARLGDLGEAMILAANGIVIAEAKALFERAAALDREDVMAQYYLGLAAKQDGRRDEAEKTWRALLARAPQGAPWISLVQNALARIDEKTAPVTDDAASAEHAGGSIQGMVERLAQRLKQDGSNLDGWIQLVRSYRVLGQADKATAAIADAKAALAGDPDKLRRFANSIKALDTELAGNAAAGQTAGDKTPPAQSGGTARSAPPAGPSEKDIAAAQALAPEQQTAMVQSMVDRLAERLKTESSDFDGWLRLMRSYKVLGQPEKARAATENARRAFAGEPEKLRQLDEAIKQLGL
jgi:cytochrome c-type biogenesis protein CcmH